MTGKITLIGGLIIIFMLLTFKSGSFGDKVQKGVRKTRSKGVNILVGLPYFIMAIIVGGILYLSGSKKDFSLKWKEFDARTKWIVGLCTFIAYLGLFTWFYHWCQ